MIAFLLTLSLLVQGIPVLPAQSGTVTGVLKYSDGKPATGVRVAAMARPESLQEAATGAALVSIGQTDEMGGYTLENIPPGRYYIVAGRVDLPTYYPGTAEMAKGTVLVITPASTISAIDFVMQTTSTRISFDGQTSRFLPVQAYVEGGGKLPVSAGKFITLQLTRTADGMKTGEPLNSSSLTVFPATEYRVTIENLPDGYVVKSLMHGSTDLTANTLKIPAAPLTSLLGGVTFSNPPTDPAGLQAYLAGLAAAAAAAGRPVGPTTPLATLSVTLATVAPPVSATPGVSVTGRAKNAENRSVYISGVPGIFYSDGTFEFRGVPPGRHVVAALDNPAPLGAFVVVGDRNVEGVTLDETSVVPFNVRTPREPGPAGSHQPGSVLPLVSLRGRVLEEVSGLPVSEGSIIITGYSQSVTYPIGPEGRFEILRLFPGSYNIEIQIFGHGRVHQTVVIGDDNVNLDLSARKLY